MEVDVISRERIKPSSPTPLPLKTFKLSFLDQLIPPFYTPLILFYPAIGNNKVEINSILSVLKTSLSEALTHYYPLAGRISDHFSISCNDEGAFYCETRIHSRIHEFLESPNLESLNRLLPFRPFVKQLYPSVPQVAVQANIFECRGLAIGVCMLHKIIDAVTMSNFLTTWATIARGCAKEFHTDFHAGSSLFPPRDQLPDEYSSAMDKGWFMEGRYVTRRFVFDPKAIDILKDRARCENIMNPTRYEALSSFIWKHATAAARATSKSSKLSVSIHSVDMRSRMEEPLSRNTIGNLLWSATSGFDSAKTEIGLSHLVAMTRESIQKINGDYLKTLQGDQGCSVIYNGIKLMLENFSLESPDSFGFSSWCNLGYRETDFGWGKPVWVGIWGGEASPFRNLVIFLETQCGLGIEAWMTLDKQILSALEGDDEFLAFALPNPSIPSV